jgi:hypothetical protein
MANQCQSAHTLMGIGDVVRSAVIDRGARWQEQEISRPAVIKGQII